jgi:hypothetical protein
VSYKTPIRSYKRSNRAMVLISSVHASFLVRRLLRGPLLFSRDACVRIMYSAVSRLHTRPRGSPVLHAPVPPQVACQSPPSFQLLYSPPSPPPPPVSAWLMRPCAPRVAVRPVWPVSGRGAQAEGGRPVHVVYDKEVGEWHWERAVQQDTDK